MIKVNVPMIMIPIIENGWLNVGRNVNLKNVKTISSKKSPYEVPLE